jgi:hypothetical protein
MKLLLAASATVFVSVVVGAVVSQVMTPDTVTIKAAASLPAPSVTVEFIAATTEIATPRPVVDAQTVQQREATYQARLAEANQIIAQSAADLANARAKEAALANKYNALVGVMSQPTSIPIVPTAIPVPATAVVIAPTTTPANIPLDVALTSAQAIDPNAKLLQKPEMVMYENIVAYEFVFDTGTIYMAAKDGAVVYNGIAVNAAAVAAARTAPPQSNDTVPPPNDRPGHRDDDDEDHQEDHQEDHHEDGDDD